MEEKNTLVAQVVCFQMFEIETSSEVANSIQIFKWEITFFLKTYITSEGAVSHNVVYYQQLSIAHYQVGFYADNYFE